MGRRRTSNPLGLPPRVYAKHGAFYYVHADGRWEHVGTDIEEAKRRGKLLRASPGQFDTLEDHLDRFLIHCDARVEAGDLAERTRNDYKRDAVPLKAFFGHALPHQVEPHHVANYLDIGLQNSRAVRANREKACLSAFFTWLIRNGKAGVKTNPCIGVRRNKETKRDRYVEHAELQRVLAVAPKQVCALLNLIYRTLQRPEDIITWTRANLVSKVEGGRGLRVIRTDQEKTGAKLDIAITPEIDAVLETVRTEIPSLTTTLIRRRDGKPYTYDGLCAMLKRAIAKANTVGAEQGLPKIASFGPYDMKGKGATDMWLSGVPLEQIQVLCGHESIKTTEVYVKRRWRGTVEANTTQISV